jgi:hypothetical protein
LATVRVHERDSVDELEPHVWLSQVQSVTVRLWFPVVSHVLLNPEQVLQLPYVRFLQVKPSVSRVHGRVSTSTVALQAPSMQR